MTIDPVTTDGFLPMQYTSHIYNKKNQTYLKAKRTMILSTNCSRQNKPKKCLVQCYK